MSAICPYRCTGISAWVRGPDRRGDSAGIEAVVALRDVDDDRDSARLRHRLECRDEGGGRDDDLVARLEACREQAEPERVEPARNADTVIDAAVLGERRLELRDGGPVREGARVEELAELLEQPLLQRGVCRREIEEGHALNRLRGLLRDHVRTVVGPLRASTALSVRFSRAGSLAGEGRAAPPAPKPARACAAVPRRG